MLFSGQEFVIAGDRVEQDVWVAVVQASKKVGTDHFQAVAARFVRAQHQGCRLDRLLDDRDLALVDLEARLLLLDEVTFEGERLFVVGDDDAIDIDGFANERAGLGVFPPTFVEVRGDARAQVLGFADVDDLSLGVLVEVDARRRWGWYGFWRRDLLAAPTVFL